MKKSKAVVIDLSGEEAVESFSRIFILDIPALILLNKNIEKRPAVLLTGVPSHMTISSYRNDKEIEEKINSFFEERAIT